MGKRLATMYCILRHNTTLRLAINQQLKSKGMSMYRLRQLASKEVGFEIDLANLHNYLSGTKPKQLSQHDIINGICKVLGLRVELKITIDES